MRALQLSHDVFTDGAEGGKDALAFKGDGFEVGNTATVEVAVEDIDREGRGQVALVPLHDEGEVSQVFADATHVHLKFGDALDVLFKFLGLRVYHEDDAVRSVENGHTCTLVEGLAWHGIEVETGAKAVNHTQVERQKVEKEGAFRFGCDGKHIATSVRINAFEDILQIGGFATVPNAIVDNFAVDFVGRDIDQRHRCQHPYLITEEQVNCVFDGRAELHVDDG